MNDVIDKRAKWTEALDAEVIKLFRSGKSHRYIGSKLGFNRNQISSRIKVLISNGFIESRNPIYHTRDWTDAQYNKLKQMYVDDVPLNKIANYFKASLNTINIKISEKMPEWGITKRGNISNPVKNSKFHHNVPDVGIEPKNISLENLDNKACKFPVNSPPVGGEYLFCGHPVKGRSPYCEAHHKLCNPKRKVDTTERKTARRKVFSL